MMKRHRHIFRKAGILVLMLFSFFTNNISAQFLGSSTNYSGSSGLAVNPSLMTTSFVYSDFGLNVGISAYNNFAFVKASDLYNILTGGGFSDYYKNGKRYDFDFVMNTKPKYFYETLDLKVLSTMYNFNGKNAFGLFVNNRVYASGTRIPWEILEIGVVSMEDGDYSGKNYQSENSKAGVMAWSEVGIAYSLTVKDRYYDKIDVGVTAKGLLGYAAAAVNLKEVDKYIINSDSTIIHKVDMTAAMSAPIDYSADFADGEVFDKNKIVNGWGAGVDIGVTYTHKMDEKMAGVVKRPCTFPKIPYVWRLGVSLLDFGAIRYNKNARVYKIYSDTDKIFDVNKLKDVKDFDSMMDTITMTFYDNTDDSFAGDSFLMGLPTALSVQFDYNIYNNFYVNASWIQPVRFFEYSVSRPPQLVVEPRFESTYFDFTLPVTLYNYHRFLVGAEMRLAFLTVGTQNIFNFLKYGDSYGLDVYVALKFNLYKGKCPNRVRRDECWNANFR